MPTQREMLDVLGLGDLEAPKPKRRRGEPKERFPEPDQLRWPRSLHEPLSPRQARLWREVIEGLCDEIVGEWRGPRSQGVQRGWPSLLAALLVFVSRRESFDPASSALGRQLEALEGGTVGCGGSDRNETEAALVRGMSSTPIERALVQAFKPRVDGYEHRYGLAYATCVELLVDAVCGLPESTKRSYRRRTTPRELAARHGLTEQTVRSIIEHGRKVVVVELAARELLPLPGNRTGLVGAVRERAHELRMNGDG